VGTHTDLNHAVYHERLKTEFHRHDGGRASAVSGIPSACFRGSGCTPHFPSGARPKSMTALVSRRCTQIHSLAACSAILRGYTSTSRHQGLPVPVYQHNDWWVALRLTHPTGCGIRILLEIYLAGYCSAASKVKHLSLLIEKKL